MGGKWFQEKENHDTEEEEEKNLYGKIYKSRWGGREQNGRG